MVLFICMYVCMYGNEFDANHVDGFIARLVEGKFRFR
jgi:hypothetical protein